MLAPDLFIQLCPIFSFDGNGANHWEKTFTPFGDNILQIFSSETSSVKSAGTRFNSIAFRLLYGKLVTVLLSSRIILVNKYELNFLHCCNSKWALSYFDKNSLKSTADLQKKLSYLLHWKPFKMMKNAFYFILKSIFVLKISKFLPWRKNDLIRKIMLISKFVTSQPG